MKIKIVTLSLFVLGCTILKAQNTDSIQKINICIDENMAGLIQLLYPEFYYSDIPEILNANLKKNLLEYKYISNFIISDSLKNDSTLVANRNIFLELAVEYYWASIYKFEVSFTDDEILNYYQNNQNKFTTPLIFDYWQVWFSNPEDEKEAKKELNNFLKMDPQIAKETKMAKKSFTINFEYDMRISESSDLFKSLNSTPLNKISDVTMINDSYIIVVPTQKIGGEIIPFEKVKEQCKSELINTKYLEFEKEKNKAIKETYNIVQPTDSSSNIPK